MPEINEVVKLERRGSVGVITVDSPPVNALGHKVRAGLAEGLKQAAADDACKAIVIACAGRTFFAGADISEFGKPPQQPGLHAVLDMIEASSKPVVAAIHGTALGGGLELALCCNWRVAVGAARFGLPEVHLGILPGAGGTQRLPRLVGVEKALDMILSGGQIGAKEAKEIGLIDEVVEGDLTAGAVKFAERVVAENRPLRKVRDMDDKVASARGNKALFDERRAAAAKKSRGFRAPGGIIDAVEAAANLPFDEGIKRERAIGAELVASPESQAQLYFFFAAREAAKIPGLSPDAKALPVASIAIIGAGTMGGGIAMAAANVGIPVTLIEMSQEALDRGLATVRKNYERSVSRGSTSADDMAKRLALITPSLKLADIANADLVLEAVFENMEVKKKLFAEIDRHAKPGAVLATNTSTLDIDEIAAATKRPESVIGMHFFSPANVMRLLEVVRGARTSDAVIATAMAFGKTLKKVPVLARVCFGFIGNRIMFARGWQSVKLPLEGADPARVDKALTEFGLPMGHLAMLDMGGLDIDWHVRQARGEPEPIVDALVEKKQLGQKTGAGIYRYEQGDRTPRPNPETAEIIKKAAAEKGIKQREVSDQEMMERQLYPMVNEAAKILEEGIAIRPSDIDVVWVYGYGWPVYRGGPTFWADQVGLKTIRDRLKHYYEQTGDETFKPAPLLERLADQGKGFADWAKEARAAA
jgi:3-hydroxyacyl-CoA dehydrogenase